MSLRLLAGLVLALPLAGCARTPAPMPLETITSAAVAAGTLESAEERLRRLVDEEGRVNDVFGRLVTSNVELCGDDFSPTFGFKLWSLDDFEPTLRPSASAALGLDERFAVYAVTSDQPAMEAGVRRGDVLISVEGKAIGAGPAGRTQYAEQVTTGLLKRGAVHFGFQRAGKKYAVKLRALKSCPYTVALTLGDEPNAATDGARVFVTSGMLAFAANDRDLAVVLGHEIAHAIKRHPQTLQEAAARRTAENSGIVGSVVGAAAGIGEAAYSAVGGVPLQRRNSLAFEIEADYVGLYLAARAGYDVSNAAGIWRRLDEEYPRSTWGDWTHPSSEERYQAMSAAAAEIAAKRENGRPLTPDGPSS